MIHENIIRILIGLSLKNKVYTMAKNSLKALVTLLAFTGTSLFITSFTLAEKAIDYKAIPPFLSTEAPPLVMLVMGKNHKLYYEAYNDAADLDEDGTLDIGYRGESEAFVDSNGNNTWDTGEAYTDFNGDGHWNKGIDYYGYFDSYKCYTPNAGRTLFTPTSAPVDANNIPTKKCAGVAEWSGDFLNYLTMSRMDALRKVLYGGNRSVDTATQTVLRRVYIPQDAHTWGKEYESIANDGFDIRDYSPLNLPPSGSRHLFASTTLSVNGDPLLRVLPNNTHRIWEWVAKERPVADSSLETGGGTVYDSYPENHQEYVDLVAQFANSTHLQGSGSVATINGVGNPFGPDDYYLNIFEGTLRISNPGTYEFAVDGDDAVELMIDGTVVADFYGAHGRCNCTSHSGTIYLAAGVHSLEFRHQERGGDDSYYLYWRGTASGLDVDTTFQIVPAEAFDSLVQSTYDVELSSASTITDYIVQVEVCNPVWPESNCKQYPSGGYKPTGLLQRYGESDRMYFGLMSGSYEKNTKGGVLRKNIKSIKDEINLTTGQMTAVNGIINTINKFRISRFNYSGYQYSRPDGGDAWVTTRPMVEREFPDWGNPTGEMMYETLRYFAGKSGPTADYDYDATSTTTVDYALGLNKEDWVNPYVLEDLDRDGFLDSGEDLNGNGTLDGFEGCSKPFMLVLSDIYPTYDSDHLPGSYFNSTFTGDMAYLDTLGGSHNLDVSDLADAISSSEGINGRHFIGQQQSAYDGACTPKTVTGLDDIRGLCPEEPTKLGSYYAAAVAYYGMQYDISSFGDEDQRVATYAVGLASPLPKIKIQVGDNEVTLVPFGKSVGGNSINATQGQFQPTNTIVDFFVEKITPTYGKFRINYEDVEQGADHDMDAIVVYEYVVNPDNTVTITLNSTYAAGGIIQHLGYIISGTSADGVYLEVRDQDTAASNDPDYFLDTPPTTNTPGTGWNDGVALPLTASRTFSVGANAPATLLENPLWYAAKWGGFLDENTPTEDINNNGILDSGEDGNNNGVIDYLVAPEPDQQSEWDEDGDGNPDSYFYVVNALRLEEQLNKSFSAMLSRASSGTAASVISNSRSGEGAVYQSIFYPTFESDVEELTWVGSVHSLFVDAYGNLREDTDGDHTLDLRVEVDRNGDGFDASDDLNGNGVLDTTLDLIVVATENGVFKYLDLNENEQIDNEDMTFFNPDIPQWHRNGVLDDEDVNGDDVFDMEDLNCDGILNMPLNEDINGNGKLDVVKDLTGAIISTEDLNGNNQLDFALNEDLNGNGILDTGEDLNGDGRMNLLYNEVTIDIDVNEDGVKEETFIVDEDTNGNNRLDHEDINCNGDWDKEDQNNNQVLDITEPVTGPFALEEIKYLWASSDWLNNNTSFDPVNQRTYGDKPITDQRYIITFVDADEDMVVDAGEQVDFVTEDPVPVAKLTDPTTIYPYLTLFSSFDDEPAQVSSIRLAGGLTTFLQEQTKRQINYIRGQDQDAVTLGSFTIPAMRNRQYEGGTKLWRLGDIVHSTPTVVARPAEAYNLLYRDKSYASFLATYQKRRSVIYVGGNDGMIHAFNGGFYDSKTKTFKTSILEPFFDSDGDGTFNGSDSAYDWDGSGGQNATIDWALGSEIWAYIPYNLLPHLNWLTEQGYPHAYYMDMKPKIFDAKIFVDGSGSEIDSHHPDGWGTVMAVGMRLGGGQIRADMNKNDGVAYVVGTDRTMRSAIVLFDITNPEMPPKVLGEIAFDGMGYTNCYPAVIPMRSRAGTGNNLSFTDNEWYLLFGSGPAEADGSPGTGDSLNKATSKQNGKVFIVDLKALITDGEIKTINDQSTITSITAKAADPTLNWYFQQIEANSFISQPVTVDYDLDFNADAAYFGTVSGDHSGWSGKLRRIVFDDEPDYSKWHDLLDIDGDGSGDVNRADNVMIDLAARAGSSQSIVTPVSVAVDSTRTAAGDRERWLFFGTGRFFVRDDAPNVDQQSYYGIKEPATTAGFTWGQVSPSNLLDVSNASVYGDRTVEDVSGVTSWSSLISSMDTVHDGWLLDFDGLGERNLGSAALLGELLTFTTYLPSQNICNIEGTSNLYGLYYKTGTAHWRPVFGFDWDDSRGTEPGRIESSEMRNRRSSGLGPGLAETPNIHTGEEDGSVAFVQTSTGAILKIEQENPGRTKSGQSAWRQRQN